MKKKKVQGKEITFFFLEKLAQKPKVPSNLETQWVFYQLPLILHSFSFPDSTLSAFQRPRVSFENGNQGRVCLRCTCAHAHMRRLCHSRTHSATASIQPDQPSRRTSYSAQGVTNDHCWSRRPALPLLTSARARGKRSRRVLMMESTTQVGFEYEISACFLLFLNFPVRAKKQFHCNSLQIFAKVRVKFD